MTEDDIRRIIQAAVADALAAHVVEMIGDDVRAVVKASVEETLLTLGLDTGEPLEVQRDFQHLRSWRQSTDTVKRQGLIAATGIIVTGLLGLVWVAVKGH